MDPGQQIRCCNAHYLMISVTLSATGMTTIDLMAQLKSVFLCIAITSMLASCGTKYSTTQPAPTRQPVELPPPPPLPTEEIPTQELPEPAVIRPTRKPDIEEARSLPAAISLRDQAKVAAGNDDHSRAIGLLERAIRISPSDPATFEALAESHLAMNRPAQALELTRRALNLNPNIEQRISLQALARRCEAQL